MPSLTGKVDFVLGIKEPPVSRVKELLDLDPGRKRRWMVFSHTHKGQVRPAKLPLARMLAASTGKMHWLIETEVQHSPSIHVHGRACFADSDRL